MSSSPVTVTLQGTQAINLTDPSISPNTQVFNPPATGEYAISANIDVTYRGSDLPLSQAFIFNTAPIETGNSYNWFLVVANQSGTTAKLTVGNPVYVFLVDQVTSSDNNGTAQVTFTPLFGAK